MERHDFLCAGVADHELAFQNALLREPAVGVIVKLQGVSNSTECPSAKPRDGETAAHTDG